MQCTAAALTCFVSERCLDFAFRVNILIMCDTLVKITAITAGFEAKKYPRIWKKKSLWIFNLYLLAVLAYHFDSIRLKINLKQKNLSNNPCIMNISVHVPLRWRTKKCTVAFINQVKLDKRFRARTIYSSAGCRFGKRDSSIIIQFDTS